MPNRLVRTPLDAETLLSLRVGDEVALEGVLYAARDAAHARMAQAMAAGKPLPFEVAGQIIYYVGPTPAPPGRPIGSAGPTTAGRMDSTLPDLLRAGLKGTLGKGGRSQRARQAMKEHQAVYFVALGGAGALLSTFIESSEVIAYEDLGPEAVRRLVVRSLPVIVGVDCQGGDLYAWVGRV